MGARGPPWEILLASWLVIGPSEAGFRASEHEWGAWYNVQKMEYDAPVHQQRPHQNFSQIECEFVYLVKDSLS